VVLKLKGSDVSSIFKHIAMEEGEAISNATLEIKDKQVESLIIGGAPLDEEKFYFVATMDYLADGNSGMEAFLNAVERIDTHLRVRDVYIEQIEKLTSQGKVVDASLDGRIKIINQ
jgi:2',3'-cyclic-nucleotide 2'-phosphodiesterase (5'-nucleotidase family)